MGYGKRRFVRSKPKAYRFKRKRAARFVRKIAKRTVVNMSETKWRITNLNANLNSGTGYENTYGNNITVGTGNDQRIGNQIRIYRIGFDVSCVYNQGNSTLNWAMLRIIVAYPKKGVSSSDLTSYFTVSNPGIYGRLDPDQALCLYDKRVMVQTPDAPNGRPHYRFKWYKYCKMAVANYENATDTLDNSWVLYIVTNASSATSAVMNVQGTVSISYKDF